MAEPSPPVMKYFEMREATFTCKCGWTGKGSETKQGDSWPESGVSEHHCPKCLDWEHPLVVAGWR